MKLSLCAFAAAGLALSIAAYVMAKPAAPGYHLIKTIHLPPSPGNTEYFDYVTSDSDARRIYVSHGTEVDVLDADKLSLVGTIGGLELCHGVAIVKDLHKGFITDGDEQKVVVFDTKTLKVTGEIKTNQPETDSIIYDPGSKRLFTFNEHTANTTAIDPVKETVIKNLDLGGNVEFAVADGKGMIYDNNEARSDIVAFDSKALVIKARWPVAPAGHPFAIAMDTKHHRLFSASRDPQFMIMMNADTGKVIQSFPITAGVDATVYEPATALVFAPTREGMLHIYHEDTPDKLTEVETVKTEYGAKTMALDFKTHNVFVSTSDFDPPAAPTEKQPHPLPRAKKGDFRVLVFGR